MTLEQQIDEAARKTMAQILNCRDDKDTKFDLLDKLYLGVVRHHPQGLAAKVLDEISAAQTDVLYSDGGAGKR
jgi:hypothetical protein